MKIVIMEPLGITEDALQTLSMLLRADGHEFIAYENRETDTEKLIERVKDADVVVLANQPFGKEVIDACKNLKLVDIAFTGVDHVDVVACKERGIILCNAAGYSTNAVAELAFGLMIDVYRYIVTCDRSTLPFSASLRTAFAVRVAMTMDSSVTPASSSMASSKDMPRPRSVPILRVLPPKMVT